MPIFQTQIPPYRAAKKVIDSWDNFRGGLNLLLRETELKANELAQADNLMLVGSGIPTLRWGLKHYFLSGATGSVRGLFGYQNSDTDTNEALAITDWGYMTKKNGASYSIITGASWASGTHISMTQLDNKVYVGSVDAGLIRYDGSSLVNFPTVSAPTGLTATNISGASGTQTYSFRVTATTRAGGETEPSDPVVISGQPQSLADGAIQLHWVTPSAASGVLSAINIYGRIEGDERYLSSTDWQNTYWYDDGSYIPQDFLYPPNANTTGGVKAKYVVRFQDRLVYGGFEDEPSKIVFSGRVPLHERNDWTSGGGLIRIEPDAGDAVNGVAVFENKIIVFKEKSIWQVTLKAVTSGNYTVLVPTAQLITASHGCISGDTIRAVENDLFFLSRDGVYVFGYEPNVLSVLRTNEVSARVRPFFEGLSIDQLKKASAVYYNHKYLLSFPGTGKTLVYDRERMAWMGPWTFDANKYLVDYDAKGERRLLLANDDNPYVEEVSDAYTNDNGSPIKTILRTKKDDFGDWSLFKTIIDVYFNFRAVKGDVSVNVKLEQRDGSTISAKSFTVTTVSGNAGWGADEWGAALWGGSEETGGASDLTDLVKWVLLNKATRSIQVEINTTGVNATYELLGIKTRATPMGRGFTPSSWKV